MAEIAVNGWGTLDRALTPSTDPDWIISEADYDPLREASRASRFAISNGFLGVRGARAIHRGGRWVAVSHTMVAGLFDAPEEEQAVPRLATIPNWLHTRILLEKKPLVHVQGDEKSQHRILDMRRGALVAVDHLSNADGVSVRLRSLHLTSLAERSIGLQLVEFEIEQGGVEVTLEAAVDSFGIGLLSERIEQGYGVWRTNSSGKRLVIAAALSLRIDDRDVVPIECGPLRWSWSWKSQPGQTICLARSVAVTRSDVEDVNPGHGAQISLHVAQQLGWSGVVAAHEAAWTSRWNDSEIEVEGDPAAQRALRFALYHLNGAANPADERVSIAARALTGTDYHGHVFWDTEIYLLPFYILTWPKAARALLMYRYHTLDGARAKAAGMGWEGALYAWESADTGAEACPSRVIAPDRKLVDVRCGKQEQHISADVAYAIWQYWEATEDDVFMREAGAEILFETARFWSSRAQLEDDGHYHIRGVIGPDEYHESIDDNAFTNGMARWNIRRALEVAALLRTRWPQRWVSLSAALVLNDKELKQWHGVAEKITTGFDPRTGLFEQFAGFYGLEDIDPGNYAGRSVPIDVVLGRERTQQSQVVKQADVVALLALLPDEFPGDSAMRNFDYYAPRCGHGSSLSFAIHGIVEARLGNTEAALDFFRNASAIDLDDNHATMDGGVHIASLGGLWMMVVFGFAGLSLGGDHLALDPKLPASWKCLSFSVQWRNRRLKIKLIPAMQRLEATLETGEPMKLAVSGKVFDLTPLETLRIATISTTSRSPGESNG